ncbi:hypothetical protein [Rhodococcus tibetensis]|uniref:hypothetical protein n=1 Tax=Rhodococcus tibetensis TaxID=2965064 RepID=UPI0035AB6F1C
MPPQVDHHDLPGVIGEGDRFIRHQLEPGQRADGPADVGWVVEDVHLAALGDGVRAGGLAVAVSRAAQTAARTALRWTGRRLGLGVLMTTTR